MKSVMVIMPTNLPWVEHHSGQARTPCSIIAWSAFTSVILVSSSTSFVLVWIRS